MIHAFCSLLALVVPLAADPEVPREIAVPPGHKLALRVEARGVQVYKAIDDGGLKWVLEGPLADLDGGKAGRHYGLPEGPAWEGADGSLVVRDAATPVAAVPAPKPQEDIPWLLVKVKPGDGKGGTLAGVAYVQRLATSGGKPPAETPRRVGTRVGVPYSATYLFWARQE